MFYILDISVQIYLINHYTMNWIRYNDYIQNGKNFFVQTQFYSMFFSSRETEFGYYV